MVLLSAKGLRPEREILVHVGVMSVLVLSKILLLKFEVLIFYDFPLGRNWQIKSISFTFSHDSEVI